MLSRYSVFPAAPATTLHGRDNIRRAASTFPTYRRQKPIGSGPTWHPCSGTSQSRILATARTGTHAHRQSAGPAPVNPSVHNLERVLARRRPRWADIAPCGSNEHATMHRVTKDGRPRRRQGRSRRRARRSCEIGNPAVGTEPRRPRLGTNTALAPHRHGTDTAPTDTSPAPASAPDTAPPLTPHLIPHRH